MRAAAPPDNRQAPVINPSLEEHLPFLDSLPVALLLIDEEAIVQACNAIGRQMFQYRNVDMLGMASERLLHEADRPGFYHEIDLCLRTNKGQSLSYKRGVFAQRKDGARFPVEIAMRPSTLQGRKLIACTFYDLSTQRKNEASLEKTKEIVKLAAHDAEIWFWEYDYRSKKISFEVMSEDGSEAKTCMDFKAWLRLVHPDYRQGLRSQLAQLESLEKNYLELEFKLKQENTDWAWIQSCGKIISVGEDKLPLRAGGTSLNVSQRKDQEYELKKQNISLLAAEQRLRLAQVSGGVASWERDFKSLQLTYFSYNLPTLYGLNATDSFSCYEHMLDRIHPADREFVRKEVESACKNCKEQFSFDYRILWPDKSTHWISLRAALIFDDAGLPVKITGTSFDVTEKKNALEQLKESEERLRNVFNQSSIPILLVSADERIIRVNEALCNLTEYDEDILLHMNLSDIVHTNDMAEIGKRISQVVVGEKDKFTVESRFITRQKNTKWTSADFEGIKSKDGSFKSAMIQIRDITEVRDLSSKLSQEISYDRLTGLLNRREFESRIVNILPGIIQKNTDSTLAYLDLDQFKVINDTCGHAAGDELLRQVSVLLQSMFRRDDVVARMGGDEFCVFTEGCDIERAQQVLRKAHEALKELRFLWDEKTFNVTISTGLVAVGEDSADIGEILRRADTACYAAKDAGRNRLHIYHQQDEELSKRSGEMDWVSKITSALEDDRFQLYCQPIAAVENSDADKLYYEVLLRLEAKDGALIPPGVFLPAAEKYGLSTRLDKWVISHTLEWLQKNPEHVARLDLCCINLSGHSIGDRELLQFIETQIAEKKLPPGKICFEITETAAVANLADATSFIQTLKKMGCLFALDDFGAGLCSFAYLKSLQVDILKIDGTFVREIVSDPVDLAMVRSINEIGKVLGKRTTAEFVENDEILALLKEIGVDRAQGYGISRPIPLNSLSQA
ncbi:MAG: EAL domain-containing protein [Gammaproteobacteria bacterium]|nr:EAL domain-containing protein [Gammaproteobacteria bacterium]